MSDHHRLPSWIALALALLLLTAAGAASADTAFAFYNGLTWNATADDMLAAEHARKSDYDTYTVGGYTLYYFEDRSVNGEDNEVGYSFYGGRMVVAAVYFGWDKPSDFAARARKVGEPYGEPTENDRDTMIALLDVISMGAVNEASVDEFTGWRLDDGTVVYLVNIEGDITVFYVNEPAISQMENDAADTKPSELPAETFVFHGGVTWDMSPEQMLAAEGVDKSDAYIETYGGSTVYALSDLTDGFEAVEIAYYFEGDQMTVAGYYYPLAGSKGFPQREADMVQALGEPTEVDPVKLVKLFNTVMRGMMDEEYITAFAGWKLADGTSFYLMNLEGDICLIYFNEPVLLADK